MFDHDAAALDKRLDAMARAVCDGDARTKDQRRADALGALAAGADRLACACGADDCPAAGSAANAVVINVIADEKTLSDDTPVTLDGENPDKPTKPIREMTLAEASAVSDPTGPSHTTPAVMIGGGDHSRAVVGGQSRCRRHDPTGDPSRRRSTRTAAIGRRPSWLGSCVAAI